MRGKSLIFGEGFRSEPSSYNVAVAVYTTNSMDYIYIYRPIAELGWDDVGCCVCRGV